MKKKKLNYKKTKAIEHEKKIRKRKKVVKKLRNQGLLRPDQTYNLKKVEG